MVAKMASEHGMQSKVSPSLASIRLAHFDQSDESDINLLLRVAKHYGAIAKPAGGYLIFARSGEGQSASGKNMPVITLEPRDAQSWSMTQAAKNSSGTVVASYYSYADARRHEIKVGEGDPVKRLRLHFKSQEEALAAARAE